MLLEQLQGAEKNLGHFYLPHPLEARVKPLGVHFRVAKKRVKEFMSEWERVVQCSHDTYEGGVHVGCRIRCAHDCCPIHHKPVWGAPVFQEHNWDQITLGFSRVHPGGRWGRPGCQCTPPLHHRPLQELARRDWKRIFFKRNGEKEVEGSPWLNPWHLSIVVSIHQDHPSLTLARNQRRLHGEEKRNLKLINDHLYVYRCDHAQGHRSSRGGSLCGENQKVFFYQTLNLFGKSEILWHLCGGCQWKEYPGVANPEIFQCKMRAINI